MLCAGLDKGLSGSDSKTACVVIVRSSAASLELRNAVYNEESLESSKTSSG